MENILSVIKQHKLIESGEVIGVAVSGGKDSMSLLHFLFSHKTELNIDIIAINVDHSIRPESATDSKFVKDYCAQHDIKFYKFKIDAPQVALDNKFTLEEAAREARYAVFADAVKRGLVNKIALAHHQSDQVETILLHILRGSGLLGASGMEYKRDNIYIRPMLDTSKLKIEEYIKENQIPFVEDITNTDCSYARNYIRHRIMPVIKEKWGNAEKTIINFGKICREDDEYIKSQINFNAIIYENNIAKIPLTYFIYDIPVLKRMIFEVLKNLGIKEDVESKHIEIIIKLAVDCESGAKIDLPMQLKAYKEYAYLTLVKSQKISKLSVKPMPVYPFKIGITDFDNFGQIIVEKSDNTTIKKGAHIIDENKLPKCAIWRTKTVGDIFKPYGGGTKKLKDYLIDKKIPLRIRANLPILADGHNIYAVAKIEISEFVKVDENTKSTFTINYSEV
ncbi:MAG: tRNA lysidine(34) synthetase TilS [Clostridia bacterium]|jgi:tRNA(Ile)-lysidine synthase